MLSYGQKHIMLSAIYIREKKTYIRISFSPNHRHRTKMEQTLLKTPNASVHSEKRKTVCILGKQTEKLLLETPR